MALCGALCSMALFGMALFGMALFGMALCSMALCSMASCSTALCGAHWCGEVRGRVRLIDSDSIRWQGLRSSATQTPER